MIPEYISHKPGRQTHLQPGHLYQLAALESLSVV